LVFGAAEPPVRIADFPPDPNFVSPEHLAVIAAGLFLLNRR
jgi:hypothetical protein